jgi:hypothetical protein
MKKEAVMAYFKLITFCLPAGNKKIDETPAVA